MIASLAAPAGRASQAPRPERTQKPALIRGRVVEATTGRPIGRARVQLYIEEATRSTLASPTGEFEFSDVALGSGRLTAQKSGYVDANYPERVRNMVRIRRMSLEPGQKVDVTIRMYRRTAITGQVLDQYGDPLEGVPIHYWRVSPYGGRLVSGSAGTNDIGEFRLGRLEPGRYVVAALPNWGWRRDDPERSAPTLGPSFYPGVASLDQAQPVDLQAGRSVSNVDFTLAEVPIQPVTGTVIDPTGAPVTTGGVNAWAVVSNLELGRRWMVSGAHIARDGGFLLRLPAGEYEIEAFGGATTSAPGWRYRVISRVSVSGAPVTNVTLTAAPYATFSGRIVFDPLSKAPANPGRVQVTLTSPVEGGDYCQAATMIDIKTDWTFAQAGVAGVCTRRAVGDDWTIKAIRAGETDLGDKDLEFLPGRDLTDVQIVLSDRLTELVADVTDANGSPTDNYVLLTFPDDREKWRASAGRVRMFSPTLYGKTPAGDAYRAKGLRGLPPGAYYAVALDDLAYDDVRDPGFLEALIPLATRMTLAEGEHRSIPLRLVRFP